MLASNVRVMIVEVMTVESIRAPDNHVGGLITNMYPIILGQQFKQSVFPA